MADKKKQWTVEELLAEKEEREHEMIKMREENADMADLLTREDFMRFRDKVGNIHLIGVRRDENGAIRGGNVMDEDEVIGVLKNKSDSLQVIEGIPSGFHPDGYKLNENDYLIIGPGECHRVTRGMEVSGTPRKCGSNGSVQFEDYDAKNPTHQPPPKAGFHRANIEERGIDQSSGKMKLADGKVLTGGAKAAFGQKPHVKDILPDQVAG